MDMSYQPYNPDSYLPYTSAPANNNASFANRMRQATSASITSLSDFDQFPACLDEHTFPLESSLSSRKPSAYTYPLPPDTHGYVSVPLLQHKASDISLLTPSEHGLEPYPSIVSINTEYSNHDNNTFCSGYVESPSVYQPGPLYSANSIDIFPPPQISSPPSKPFRSISRRARGWSFNTPSHATIPEEDDMTPIVKSPAPISMTPISEHQQKSTQYAPVAPRDSSTETKKEDYLDYFHVPGMPAHYGTGSGLLRSLSRKLSHTTPIRSPSFRFWGQSAPAYALPGQQTAYIPEHHRHHTDIDDKEYDHDHDPTFTGIDLSVIEGPKSMDDVSFVASRRSTLARTLSQAVTSSLTLNLPLRPDKDIETPNWRPFTMRTPYLSFLVVISIIMTSIIEILYRIHKNDGLFEFKEAQEFSTLGYFTVRFMPILGSVIYGVLWQVADYDIKRLEAYHQLSLPGGALASRSLNVDYVTGSLFLRPFEAYRHKHWAVFVSSIATVLSVSVVPTLASAIFKLEDNCINSNINRPRETHEYKCFRLQKYYLHSFEGMVLLCTVCAIALLVITSRHKSGLRNDPRGIAGIAMMATAMHIMDDFQGMDVATHDELHRRLKRKRYRLWNNALTAVVVIDDKDETPLAREKEEEEKNHALIKTNKHENPHPFVLRLPFLLAYLAYMILFAGFFTAFQIVPRIPEFLDWAPWLPTVLAILVKLGWGSIDKCIRMIEPYYILSKRHAPAKTLILDYTALPFGHMPVQALVNRHWIMALVGFGTVFVEVLTVMMTGLTQIDKNNTMTNTTTSSAYHFRSHDDNSSTIGFAANDTNGIDTPRTFIASFSIALAILIYLPLTATVILWKRRHPFLPRQPNTISSVLAYIHQSKMLLDFEGTSEMATGDVEERLAGMGKTYGLGVFKGLDRKVHVGVDEEDLDGSYRHGQQLFVAAAPWSEGDFERY